MKNRIIFFVLFIACVSMMTFYNCSDNEKKALQSHTEIKSPSNKTDGK